MYKALKCFRSRYRPYDFMHLYHSLFLSKNISTKPLCFCYTIDYTNSFKDNENSISKCNFADKIGKFVFSEPGGTSPPCSDGKNYLYCLPTKVDIYESFNQRTKIYYLHNVAKWLSTK